MNDCHLHAERGSRAISKSENSRNSPRRGESTSPTLAPLPGKSVPLRSVCGELLSSTCAAGDCGQEAACLDEELGIERARSRVERRTLCVKWTLSMIVERGRYGPKGNRHLPEWIHQRGPVPRLCAR